MFRKSFIWNSITILSRHCAGIVCAERRRKHGTICTDPERHRKDKSKHNCARMATKSGYPGKRPGNIPADVRGVQVRLERIAEHAKRNHHLGRLSPAYFPCAGALCHGSIPGGTVRKRLFAVLRRSDRQTVRSTAQAVKTPYRAKYKP